MKRAGLGVAGAGGRCGIALVAHQQKIGESKCGRERPASCRRGKTSSSPLVFKTDARAGRRRLHLNQCNQ